MFLRRLSSSSSSSIHAPPLWWLAWGCRLPPGCLDRGGGRPVCTSSGPMEPRPPHRNREPPHKRRRSTKEKEAHGGSGASPKNPGPGSMQRDAGEHRGSQGGHDGGPLHPQQGHASQSNNQQQVGGANNLYIDQPGNHVGEANRPPISQFGNQGQVGGANRSPINQGTICCSNGPPPPLPGTSLSVKPLQRHWESCSTAPLPAGSGRVLDFSVMSYNLLSQDLLQDNAYLYRHCSPALLAWSYRLPNLLSEIRRHSADILCLQEVQQDHYEDQIRPALQELGYQCEYKKRTGSKPDGCAVVFRTALFSLLSSNPVEFFRAGDALLDRDNVGQVLLLRLRHAPAGSASFICVANTHLLYNPRRGDVKLAQLAILLAELGRLAHLPDGSTNPVLLCGDFNSAPNSPLYSFLTQGRLDYAGLQIGMVSGQENSSRGQRLLSCPIWSSSVGVDQRCQYAVRSVTAVDGAISELSVVDGAATSSAILEHTLNLRSTYLHRLKPDGRSEVTTCHSRTAMTVDYILYSPDMPGGRGLQLLRRLSLVGQAELEEIHGLPNQHHSSDHLPLLARFRLRT
ncbi:unnamed protein product [Ophioblennius macclurei]